MIYLLLKKDYQRIISLGIRYDNNFVKKYLEGSANIYVYEQSNHILGFLITEQTIDEENILLLYVSPENRNQGIGSKLLNYLLINQKNSTRVILEVNVNNDKAIRLYKKFRFSLINVRKKYYKDGSDALVMEKRINNE